MHLAESADRINLIKFVILLFPTYYGFMIGAVIADLAAWTWRHNREYFYTRLISEDAKLSGYGLLALELYDFLKNDTEDSHLNIASKLRKILRNAPDCAEVEDEWKLWARINEDSEMPDSLRKALIAICVIDLAFINPSEGRMRSLLIRFARHEEVESALDFMKIVIRLRAGSIKSECIRENSSLVSSMDSHQSSAWGAFYSAYDFTSTIHNAVHVSDGNHLAVMLGGTLAQAAYGCFYMMTKQKYGARFEEIEFPTGVMKYFGSEIKDIRYEEHRDRKFFAKNEALTNVELHTWHSIDNPFTDFLINEELRRRLMLAFHTDWEQRYGVYFDDGWHYVYRSNVLLFRFRLEAVKDGCWYIAELQKSEDPRGNIADVESVMTALERFWYVDSREGSEQLFSVSNESAPANMKFCHYYRGETQCPPVFKGKEAERYWYGEKMFIDTGEDIEKWVAIARNFVVSSPDYKGTEMPIESAAIHLYVESLKPR